jgi:hypothetical protein
MHYDRARTNLERDTNYILTAYLGGLTVTH